MNVQPVVENTFMEPIHILQASNSGTIINCFEAKYKDSKHAKGWKECLSSDNTRCTFSRNVLFVKL